MVLSAIAAAFGTFAFYHSLNISDSAATVGNHVLAFMWLIIAVLCTVIVCIA